MDDKIVEFLKVSVADIQATIRSTDIKSGLLMTALVVPLTNLKDLPKFYMTLHVSTAKYPLACGYFLPSAVILLSCMCLLAWLCAFFSTLRVLFPIYQKPLTNNDEKLSKLDSFFLGGVNRYDNTPVPQTIQQVQTHLPTTSADMISVLLWEQIKLARVRARKLRYLKTCVISLGVLFVCGLATMLGYFWLVVGFFK